MIKASASLLIGASTLVCALAQTAGGDSTRPSLKPDAVAPSKSSSTQEVAGAVRLARFSFVEGRVLWRPDSAADWSEATVNLPVQQGAQITTDDGARAEIQFDDGSTVRITDNAVLTLQTLYSDADGEFTELKVNDGTASVHLLSQYSIYQLDTPDGDVKVAGSAKIRLDATSYLKVAVREGDATFSTVDGEYKLREGDFAEVRPSEAKPEIEDLPAPDDWDAFCDSRDNAMTAPADDHLPPDIARVAGNLDDYGTWVEDATYGEVWLPSGQTAAWRPYSEGQFDWVGLFGWTWVSSEPWGWAPYHYGTWIHRLDGWAWLPGPRHQAWCPAVVTFTTVGTTVTWVPLAPCEVHYTPVACVFRHGDWSNCFSIGACGTYFIYGPDFVSIRLWDTGTINRGRLGDRISLAGFGKTTMKTRGFRPHNSLVGGATQATLANFQRGEGYTAARKNSLSLFIHGMSAVLSGNRIISGPANIHPTLASTTPTRAFVASSDIKVNLDRPVFGGKTADPAKILRISIATPKVATAEPARGPISQTASPMTGTPRTTQTARPRATWNPAPSVADKVASVRASLGYSGHSSSTTRPDADTYVRHSRQSRNTDSGSGTPQTDAQASRAGTQSSGWGQRGSRQNGSPRTHDTRPAAPPQTQSDTQDRSGGRQPRAEQPRQEPPRQEQPRQEPPRQEPPRQEQPRQEQPRQEQPRQEQPRPQPAPQPQPQPQPKPEPPRQEQPKPGQSKH